MQKMQSKIHRKIRENSPRVGKALKKTQTELTRVKLLKRLIINLRFTKFHPKKDKHRKTWSHSIIKGQTVLIFFQQPLHSRALSFDTIFVNRITFCLRQKRNSTNLITPKKLMMMTYRTFDGFVSHDPAQSRCVGRHTMCLSFRSIKRNHSRDCISECCKENGNIFLIVFQWFA